jgi:xanthine/uracil permease
VAAAVASSTRQSDRHGPYLLSRFGTALSGNLNRPGFYANAVNFGVVAVQRLYSGKVVAVVVISMMSSGLIERR